MELLKNIIITKALKFVLLSVDKCVALYLSYNHK